MKAFVFDAAKCNGCYGCQIACKDEHVGNDWSPIAAPQPDTGSFWCRLSETTHGQVPKVRVEYRPYFCNQCDSCELVELAPDAVCRRSDGLVIIDSTKAKGREYLVDACPYGAVYWNAELQLPQKCTGCAHLVDEGELPHCVDVCATGALRFGDEEELAAEIADAVRLTDEAHGGHVYYRNLPKLFISGDVWDPIPDEIVEGADVTLLDAEGAAVATTTTDGFGDFWFNRLDAGAYRVRVEAAGYQSQERAIELSQSTNIGDFALQAQG